MTPDKGSLSVGESMQVHVQFNALKTGDYNCNMLLSYDTGNIILKKPYDVFCGLAGIIL